MPVVSIDVQFMQQTKSLTINVSSSVTIEQIFAELVQQFENIENISSETEYEIFLGRTLSNVDELSADVLRPGETLMFIPTGRRVYKDLKTTKEPGHVLSIFNDNRQLITEIYDRVDVVAGRRDENIHHFPEVDLTDHTNEPRKISRRHLQFFYQQSQWYVQKHEDAKMSAFVDGRLLQDSGPVALMPGSQITIGPSVNRYIITLYVDIQT